MCLAIPARVCEFIEGNESFAWVDIMGVRRKVSIDLLRDDPPERGDWVLIHVGFAMTKISSEDAQEQLQLLELMGEVAEAGREAGGYRFGED